MAKKPMKAGKSMAPAGSRNHNTAAVAAISMAEISNCCSASDAEGRRSVKRPNNRRSRPSRHRR